MLLNLRAYMAQNAIDAMIIPSNDPHFGEYVPDRFKQRELLSGFTGEAGTLAVTASKAALWTDSRFFISAAEQLKGSGISLMKLKVEGTPTIAQWLSDNLQPGGRVAVDGDLYSLDSFRSLERELHGLALVAVDDPFDGIWPGRPALPFNPVELMPQEYSGASARSKHEALISRFSAYGNFAYIISECDQVMWMFNVRGSDIEYNAVAISYAVVTPSDMYLFVEPSAVEPRALEYLASEGVTVCRYSDFKSFLSALPDDVVRIAPLSGLSLSCWTAAGGDSVRFVDDSGDHGYISFLRSRKNPVEVEGFRKAFLLDGIAWVKVLKHIDDNIAGGSLTEWNVSRKFIEYRSASDLYRGESFEPIVAFGPNAAAPHYSISGEGDCSAIRPHGFLLMDTGGHYACGTTDTTRTLSFGEMTSEQKRDYTLVLKGMIQLACAKFPAGTRGAQLDILARGPVFSGGRIYYHGTGHGIGHRLCVHESPQIRMEESPIVLDRGMILSDEPGIYLEGRYGIRIENCNLITDYLSSDISYFQFEPLTLVPIETRSIDKKTLGAECAEWLNCYNRRVLETLSPYLTRDEKRWLEERTTSI